MGETLAELPFTADQVGLFRARPGRPKASGNRLPKGSARKGGGAFLNGQPIKVSGETELTHARICVGFSYRRSVAEHAGAIGAVLGAGCEYLRLGSGALGLAYAAAGRIDTYWERHMNSWDAAAGLILVREAGGSTNDFLAGDGLVVGGEVLAATPALFEPLKRLIACGSPRCTQLE